MMDYHVDSPQILIDFLSYHEIIKGHSQKTVDEYYLDLRNFFRFMIRYKNPRIYAPDTPLDEISIKKVNIEFIKDIQLEDIYTYLTFLSRDREKYHNSESSKKGLSASTRARKISSIRSFYKFLQLRAHVIEENPVKDLDSPKLLKSIPHYLTYDESLSLLQAPDGHNKERDYCILTLFLNCGLRISELINLDISDVSDETIRILGKGNKERILYLNDACKLALKDYLNVRRPITGPDKDALFLSSQNKRISRSGVHSLVKKELAVAGLDSTVYSTHKLRHTAATLMLQNGVDVKAVQEVLGHEHLNTTEIYTHIDNEDLRIAARSNPLSKVKPTVKKEVDNGNKETD